VARLGHRQPLRRRHGRYVSIGGCATDPSRVLGSFDLFDTEANQHVKLPVSSPDSITFVGAGILIHGRPTGSSPGSFTIIKPDGSVITKLTEPGDLPYTKYLSYTPPTP
jgi:hypothetical protein